MKEVLVYVKENQAMQFVLVMGAIVFLVAYVSGYGTNNPSIFGHSSDEVQYVFNTYTTTCTAQNTPFCSASCANPATQWAISGNCVNTCGGGGCIGFPGWAAPTSGVVDSQNWDCVDYGHQPGDVFIAQVVCETVN